MVGSFSTNESESTGVLMHRTNPYCYTAISDCDDTGTITSRRVYYPTPSYACGRFLDDSWLVFTAHRFLRTNVRERKQVFNACLPRIEIQGKLEHAIFARTLEVAMWNLAKKPHIQKQLSKPLPWSRLPTTPRPDGKGVHNFKRV